jgi:hypothetical protein
MELTFFITPLQALHLERNTKNSKETALLTESVSAKVQVEQSTQLYRLTIDPNLFIQSKTSFHPISEHNSVLVHLTLVLCFNVDIPVCAGILEKLHQTMYGPGQSIPPLTTPHIDQLILMEEAKEISAEASSPTIHKIYLPGQVHEYLGICKHDVDIHNNHRGVMLPNRKVPFTHPVHVIKTIQLLRQQLMYNNLLKSCLRSRRKPILTPSEVKQATMSDNYSFEVNTFPPEKISLKTELLTSNDSSAILSFEFHIPQESTNPPTQPFVFLSIGNDQKERAPVLEKIIAKCMSIPCTIYSALSRPESVLPPVIAAAVTDHQQTLQLFIHQLKSPDVSSDLMNVKASILSSDLGGPYKRKRIE